MTRDILLRMMGRAAFDEQGFTLTELMIAVVLSSIVFLTIGTMLVTMQRYWDRTSSKVAMIREASAAMDRVSYELRRAKRDSVFAYGDSVQIWREGARLSFRREGVDLVLRSGTAPARLVEDTVDSLRFSYASADSSAVAIYLKVSDSSSQTQLSTVARMRN